MKFDILNQTEETVLIGEGSIKNKKAKITEKNTPYIFSLLSKIYSNPPGAIVQEVTSNCFDAQVKASKLLRAEAEVLLLQGGDLEKVDELLTQADEKLKEVVFVRHYLDETNQDYIEFVDNGTGISVDLMDDVFMSYGESDKRDSDDFIGAFGLGSKSPFSYSDHFYVITKQNGIKYTYLLYETAAGPEYDILAEEETEEGNGTTIRVPIKKEDLQTWENNIIIKLKYFSNVYVVNFPGVKNDYKIRKFKTFQLREDLFKAKPNDPLHLVIGEVNYPLDLSLLKVDGLPSTHGLNVALTFNIGELKVTPNREALEYNDQTIDAIKLKLNDFYVEIKELLTDKKFFVSDTLLSYREDVLALEKNIMVNRTLLDEPINIGINELKFLKKEEIRYSVKIGDHQTHFDIKHLSPYASTEAILMRGDYTNDHKLTKFNSVKNNYTEVKRLHDVFTKNSGGLYIIIPKNKVKLKQSERAYLNDNLTVDRVIKFDLKKYVKNFITNLKIFNLVDNTEKTYKDLTYAEVVNLVRIFRRKVQEDIFSINFKHLSEYNISDNYGKDKRPPVTLEEGNILSYIYQDSSFTRGEWETKKLYERLSTGDLKDKIILYTEEADKHKLINLRNYCFSSLAHSKSYHQRRGIKNSKDTIIFFYCAKKYFKVLEMMPNTYHINKLYDEKENSKFFKNMDVIQFIASSVKANIINSLLDNKKGLEYSGINYETIQTSTSKNKLVNEFEKLIKKENWLNLPKEVVCDEYIAEVYLKQFLSPQYYTNLKSKIEGRLSKIINTSKLWDSIKGDFLLELEYFYTVDKYSGELKKYRQSQIEILEQYLEPKKEKIKQYIKQIKAN